MDLELDSLQPSPKKSGKISFLTHEEWQQVEKARERNTMPQIYRWIRDKLRMENRPFYTSRDVFARSYYLWRNGETQR